MWFSAFGLHKTWTGVAATKFNLLEAITSNNLMSLTIVDTDICLFLIIR